MLLPGSLKKRLHHQRQHPGQQNTHHPFLHSLTGSDGCQFFFKFVVKIIFSNQCVLRFGQKTDNCFCLCLLETGCFKLVNEL